MPGISRGAFQAYRLTAIVSLVFALVGFSYNAWRLEQSEENNIVRSAAFQILIELAEFEQIVVVDEMRVAVKSRLASLD